MPKMLDLRLPLCIMTKTNRSSSPVSLCLLHSVGFLSNAEFNLIPVVVACNLQTLTEVAVFLWSPRSSFSALFYYLCQSVSLQDIKVVFASNTICTWTLIHLWIFCVSLTEALYVMIALLHFALPAGQSYVVFGDFVDVPSLSESWLLHLAHKYILKMLLATDVYCTQLRSIKTWQLEWP